jgi:hypothetical protein
MQSHSDRSHFAVQMRQNPIDNRRILNAGNDLDLPGAPLAGLDVDIEHSLEPLHLYALGVQVIEAWRSAGVLSSQFSPAG